MNRLQFLRGNYKSEPSLRPPWSQVEDVFVDVCDRCDKCITACHNAVIKRGSAGFPEMNFASAGCDFCEACVEACPTQAIQLTDVNRLQPWIYKASINNTCFSERGIVCRSCGEVCEMRAIRFKLAVGGVAHIEFNTQDCNGCGECVSVCPANAIAIKYVEQKPESHT